MWGCDLHSALHGPPFPTAVRWLNPAPDVVRFFDHDVRSAAAARQLVRQVLDSWNDAELTDDAALVVSELVGNAARHTGGGFHVILSRTPSGIRITVADSDPQPPVPRTASPNAVLDMAAVSVIDCATIGAVLELNDHAAAA